MEEMRKRKLFIATPMYGGQCYGSYTRSLMDLTLALSHYGIQFRVYFIFNESLIQRARNYCAAEFLDSDCTHMLFIDSDISFKPDDVLTMLALQGDESPYDVIGGPYPKKAISWEKILHAVNRGVADQNPALLEQFVGDYVFNPRVAPDQIGKPVQVRLDEPLEVSELGTGFMMIRRQTLEKYAEAYPHTRYTPDHVRTDKFDGSRQITAFFDCEIDPDSQRYLSEDYLFCRNVWNMGGQVWLCPWMSLQHTGTYVFGGSLQAILTIGAAPTADPELLNQAKKGKKK
jgi:hypothetical protein